MSNKTRNLTQMITVGKYSLVGRPTDFYVYSYEHKDNSAWFRGKLAFNFWIKMKRLASTDKPKFIAEATILYNNTKAM